MEKSAWGQGSLGKVNIITLATLLPTPIIISLVTTHPEERVAESDVAVLQVGAVPHQQTRDPLHNNQSEDSIRVRIQSGVGIGLKRPIRAHLATLLEQRSLAGELQRARGVVVGVEHARAAGHEVADHLLALLPD